MSSSEWGLLLVLSASIIPAVEVVKLFIRMFSPALPPPPPSLSS
jgi:hypothetical protein